LNIGFTKLKLEIGKISVTNSIIEKNHKKLEKIKQIFKKSPDFYTWFK